LPACIDCPSSKPDRRMNCSGREAGHLDDDFGRHGEVEAGYLYPARPAGTRRRKDSVNIPREPQQGRPFERTIRP